MYPYSFEFYSLLVKTLFLSLQKLLLCLWVAILEIWHQDPHPPSSSLLSPVISTDSESEAKEVRLEEAAEVTLACLLPGSRLTQCSHREELVEPVEKEMGPKVSQGAVLHTFCQGAASQARDLCPHSKVKKNSPN